ncbi:MAG TPA: sodium:solute symporter, partial [Fredinandcohnia sp.]|nr:sodium:solute symporter [Fredinandcohnia sp.]
MSPIDWIVLFGTTLGIVVAGVWSSRNVRDVAGYLKGDGTVRWPTIGLSIMATQASAITFLSVPGQAFQDGMGFVQFYFGLPLAMIVIAAVFVPIYYRLNVYTAYEYLEHRFDGRVRFLGAILFLVQRGLGAGITIYAPSIVLSTILGWRMDLLIVGIGLLVIVYTVSGGSNAVARTQKQQMIVILLGMCVAGLVAFWRLPEGVTLPGVVKVAGALDRMQVVRFDLDWTSRYNFWSGITGGFFLALSYFGTDQSQVQRYLTGRSVTESRLGLVFNGLFKIPMQFGILFVGILVFAFYLFEKPPLHFNPSVSARVAEARAKEWQALEARFDTAFAAQREAAAAYFAAKDDPAARERLRAAHAEVKEVRKQAQALAAEAVPDDDAKESDFVFISFVLAHLPKGLVGLLLAVIFAAAMSSSASELAALGSTTMVDLYRRHRRRKEEDPRHDLLASKVFTVFWGLVAIAFASFASLVDNLIQAVNILGSIFYGTVLGLFVVAFFLKRVGARAVFPAALIAQAVVLALFFTSDLGFLWYNVVGCAIVVVLG